MRITILPNAMKALEGIYMKNEGIPSILLMEQAAHGILDAIRHFASPGDEVVFLCGPGANGGDGYAAAKLWSLTGGISLILETSHDTAGDAHVNRSLAISTGCLFPEPSQEVFAHARLIVDALFGTGLSKPVSGDAAHLISLAADSGLQVIAVDIPSGLSGATGDLLGPCLHCVETITFHRPKDGLYLKKGPSVTGRIVVHPIFIPENYGMTEGCTDDFQGMHVLEEQDLPALLPSRPKDAHKGTFGRTVIFAGSEGMAGAAAFCAGAAIRGGSGLTTILCLPALLPVLQTLVPGATCRVLPDLGEKGLSIAADTLNSADRAIIGCGLSQSPDLLPFLELFRKASCPVVWDADALNLLAAHPELLPLPAMHIITPHPGEAARLLRTGVSHITDQPLLALRELHTHTGAHVLLKGACTLMTDGTHVAVHPFPTPALAKGGSGDLLSGLLAGLIGRVHEPQSCLRMLRTMQTAVFLHARAGQRAAEVSGEDSVTPEDILRAIRLF